jgi:hypothetical protein
MLPDCLVPTVDDYHQVLGRLATLMVTDSNYAWACMGSCTCACVCNCNCNCKCIKPDDIGCEIW